MTRRLSSRVGDAFRRLALPLAAYYGITLAVPLANGAWRSAVAFAEHAIVVLVVPPIVIALACAVGTTARACVDGIRSEISPSSPNGRA